MKQAFGKDQWVELFRKIGLSDTTMEKWHRSFEAEHPSAHESFLQWLKLSSEEVKAIRKRFS
jgi:hypothetical protein